MSPAAGVRWPVAQLSPSLRLYGRETQDLAQDHVSCWPPASNDGQCESMRLWPPCPNLSQLQRASQLPIGSAAWQFDFPQGAVLLLHSPIGADPGPPPGALPAHKAPSHSLLLMKSILQHCQLPVTFPLVSES